MSSRVVDPEEDATPGGCRCRLRPEVTGATPLHHSAEQRQVQRADGFAVVLDERMERTVPQADAFIGREWLEAALLEDIDDCLA